MAMCGIGVFAIVGVGLGIIFRRRGDRGWDLRDGIQGPNPLSTENGILASPTLRKQLHTAAESSDHSILDYSFDGSPY